jgi:hypothetical protein
MTSESPTSTGIRAPEPPGQPLAPSLTSAVVATGRRETAVLPTAAEGFGWLAAGDEADDLLLQW